METFKICDLFETIGEICIEPCGLYYTFDARIDVKSKSIQRCYYHCAESRVSLGVFVPDGAIFKCVGKIARKQLPESLADGQFSILESAWSPLCAGNGQVYAAECTRHLPHGAAQKIVIRRYGEFPEQLLPLCCFFQPERIGSHDCLALFLDEAGRPIEA